MLTFNLKKQWFDKIKRGEKTHEYREIKPYWTKRLWNINQEDFFNSCGKYLKLGISMTNGLRSECTFVCGYAKKDDKDKRLKARIKNISIINGKNTDLAVDKDVFDIEFELIGDKENVCKD